MIQGLNLAELKLKGAQLGTMTDAVLATGILHGQRLCVRPTADSDHHVRA